MKPFFHTLGWGRPQSNRAPAFAALALSGLGVLGNAALADTYTDHFDKGVVDTNYWDVQLLNGSTLDAVNGRLEMTQGSGPDPAGGASLHFKHAIAGDFSAQIDFTLMNWPANNKERAGLMTNLANLTALAAVSRVSDSDYSAPEFYGSFFYGDGPPAFDQLVLPTSDASGRLRLSRAGDTFTTWYWHDNTWQAIDAHTYTTPVGPITDLQFGIWKYFKDTPGVKVAFDNFYLDAPGTTIPAVPEPEALYLMLAGVAVLALARRMA